MKKIDYEMLEPICGFEPVFDESSQLLILGSFPSVKSRAAEFYYGNPRNKFWDILRQSFGETFGDGRMDKIRFLTRHKIALWDVVQVCKISGSADSTLKTVEIADIPLIMSASDIAQIILNGRTAQQLFIKHFPQYEEKCVYLPSTSPANARGGVTEVWVNTLRAFSLKYGL